MIREIVTIDEKLCDGCGLCIPACHEGALRIVDGKARLVSDRLCDGLGACLGHCPRGAICVERRESENFDEHAVATHRRALGTTGARRRKPASTPAAPPPSRNLAAHATVPHAGGCPGSRLAQFAPAGALGNGNRPAAHDSAAPPSALTHWPVQLRLLPPFAPFLAHARLLVAADCVPVAYADFHDQMLRGHAVVIACPKLDDTRGYVEKLAEMIRLNELAEITVAHMEVPCCTGILHAVLEARRLARRNVPVQDVVIGLQGQVLERRAVPAETSASR